MNIWRISNFADLSGRGGLLAQGRWHDVGNPVVYCSDHPSTALLEILVHVDPELLPDDFQLLRIACPDDTVVSTIELDRTAALNPTRTRELGTQWLAARSACLLKVACAILPEAWNYLINPAHPQAPSLRIESTSRYPFDPRLFPL